MPKKKRVLKRSKTGMETEFHLIDEKGRISNRAYEIIMALKTEHKEVDVTKEIGRNMIEFGCYPDVATYNPTMDMITTIEKAWHTCAERGLKLYPFATYPGQFKPEFTPGAAYDMKKKIFGFPRIEHSCRATGFHHHYTLPKGVFDAERKMIKLLRKSKLERAMVSSYNFEIAADPALTLFTQCSPFYQGSLLAKDSRIVIYRGGRKLRYTRGLYSNLQQIGGLPPYKQTVTDLLSSLHRRWQRWKKEVKKVDPNANFDELYPFKLEIGWHPVKINKHGTLEQRGMDINYMSIIVAVTVLLKFCLKKIQREFIEVVPADFAVVEPFKLEGNILYIPPHTHVRNQLQTWSAYHGYDHKQMYNFARRFFTFARSLTPKRYNAILRPVYDMIDKKESVSDMVMRYAKKKDYLCNGNITDDDSAKLALYYADKFYEDLQITKNKLNSVSV